MHAALVNLTIAPDEAPPAANALTHDILPAIRSAPGFVAGYWLEPVDGHGFSFVVFETEEQARQSARRPATGPPPASPSTMSTSGEWLPAPKARPSRQRVRLGWSAVRPLEPEVVHPSSVSGTGGWEPDSELRLPRRARGPAAKPGPLFAL
jgi:hypothetical protein